MKNIWQPEFDENGDVKGHPGECIWSFEVYSSKQKLLEDFPNSIPIKYKSSDIEKYTIIK